MTRPTASLSIYQTIAIESGTTYLHATIECEIYCSWKTCTFSILTLVKLVIVWKCHNINIWVKYWTDLIWCIVGQEFVRKTPATAVILKKWMVSGSIARLLVVGSIWQPVHDQIQGFLRRELSQYYTKPTAVQWSTGKHTQRCLKGTKNKQLCFRKCKMTTTSVFTVTPNRMLISVTVKTLWVIVSVETSKGH